MIAMHAQHTQNGVAVPNQHTRVSRQSITCEACESLALLYMKLKLRCILHCTFPSPMLLERSNFCLHNKLYLFVDVSPDPKPAAVADEGHGLCSIFSVIRSCSIGGDGDCLSLQFSHNNATRLSYRLLLKTSTKKKRDIFGCCRNRRLCTMSNLLDSLKLQKILCIAQPLCNMHDAQPKRCTTHSHKIASFPLNQMKNNTKNKNNAIQ